MSEQIDIFDANLKKLGSADRVAAHRDGAWHRTFHLWIVSEENRGSLIFQLRSPKAKNYPNLLDITAAGHLHAGEELADGVREVSEELGIVPQQDQLHWLGYRIEVADQDNGQRNREYQGVFLLKDNRALANYCPDPNEVYGLLSIPIAAGMKLFSGKVQSVDASGIRYEASTHSWGQCHEVIVKDRFLPRIQNYYLTVLIMAERLLDGRQPLSIS